MAWVGGREIPDVTFGADARQVSGHLVPVTTWVHPDLLIPGQSSRASGGYGGRARSPYALGGLVVGVAVVATLAVSLVIALLALVAWVTAHAVAVGIGIVAVVGSALALLYALTPDRDAGPAAGGCCRWEHHDR